MSAAAYPGPWYQAMKAERDALLERVTVLERALEWYADPANYDHIGPKGTVKGGGWRVVEDAGQRAREALDGS